MKRFEDGLGNTVHHDLVRSFTFVGHDIVTSFAIVSPCNNSQSGMNFEAMMY